MRWYGEVLGDGCLFLRFTILSGKKFWWLGPIIVLPNLLTGEMTWDWVWVMFVSVVVPVLFVFAALFSSGLIFAIHGIRLQVSQAYKQQFDGKDEDETLRMLESIYHGGV